MSTLLYCYFCNLNQSEVSPFIHQLLRAVKSRLDFKILECIISYQIFYLPFYIHMVGV